MDTISFEDFCSQNNILIHIYDKLSTKIRGFCYYDGIYYHVIINNRYAFPQQQKTFLHEVTHIMENHFSCHVDDRDTCEKQTRTLVDTMLNQFDHENQ